MIEKYRVCGSRPYLGNEPGDEFEAELPADVRDRAIARGSIEIVTGETPVPPAEGPATSDNDSDEDEVDQEVDPETQG